ncbi:MAG: hypothetical protein M1833_006964 [Piccolia ochrophora]|nr:MAG: hypothetical protein M1833_006964 [Piccolia ochrophora]
MARKKTKPGAKRRAAVAATEAESEDEADEGAEVGESHLMEDIEDDGAITADEHAAGDLHMPDADAPAEDGDGEADLAVEAETSGRVQEGGRRDDRIQDSADDDPVEHEFDVYLTNSDADAIHLFQYPNRASKQSYTDLNYARPLQVRIKPRAELVEVDIPMNLDNNFDRHRAVQWGEALKKSTTEKAGGSHGLPGGFGIGASSGFGANAGKKIVREDAGVYNLESTQEMLRANFAEANATGRVLNRQVLGGQVNPVGEKRSTHMIGAFRGGRLFLSRINAHAQLRPQFHHIDATVEQQRASARLERDIANPRQQEARAVQMTVKAADGDDMDMSDTFKTLRAAQEEKWVALDYADENSTNAWDCYEKLFPRDEVHLPSLRSAITPDEYISDSSAPQVSVTRAGKNAPIQKAEEHTVQNMTEGEGEDVRSGTKVQH